MGTVAIAHLIWRTAPAMRRAAQDLRKCTDAEALAKVLRSDAVLDVDDRDMLADLISGQLNRKRGDRGASYKPNVMRDAEAAARVHAKHRGVSLKVASDAVATQFGLQPNTLFNHLRRSKKPSKSKRSK